MNPDSKPAIAIAIVVTVVALGISAMLYYMAFKIADQQVTIRNQAVQIATQQALLTGLGKELTGTK